MQSIAKVANLLNVSEYRLFSEAYLAKFGDRAEEEDIAVLFSQFMMFGEVPDWANEYARTVLADLEANRNVNLNSYCLLNLAPRTGDKENISFTLLD